MDELVIEKRPGWALVTINRPQARNALNTALLGKLADELDALSSDAACRGVVLAGAGGHFAAGADINEIEHKSSSEGAVDPRKDYWLRIRVFPKPIIAAVDGFCLGGGFELALMSDGIVAGETARFGLPETNLGLIPGAGGGQRLMAIIGRARATRMVLFGEIIDAAQAEAWGLAAWHVAGPALPEAERLMTLLAARAPLALAAAKRAIISGEENALALSEERRLFETLLDSADKKEGIAAFREKRKAEFKGE
jgi:enoyl-CoA hydratase